VEIYWVDKTLEDMMGVSCSTDRRDDECIWRNESNHVIDQGIDEGIILNLDLIKIEWML